MPCEAGGASEAVLRSRAFSWDGLSSASARTGSALRMLCTRSRLRCELEYRHVLDGVETYDTSELIRPCR